MITVSQLVPSYQTRRGAPRQGTERAAELVYYRRMRAIRAGRPAGLPERLPERLPGRLPGLGWGPPWGMVVAALMAVVVAGVPGTARADKAGAIVVTPTAATPTATPVPGRQRVAVVRLDFEGTVAEAGRELFASRVVEGLAAVQFEVFAGGAVTRKLAAAGRKLASCRDGGCYPAVAQVLEVGYLVSGRVSESNKNYELDLELINGRTGGVIGTNRERCEICGVDEAAEKMALAASALRTRLEALVKAPARFIIRSRPAGVALAIDGAPIGRTPIDRDLPGGPHKLELSAAGYDRLERTVTVVSGVDETIDLDLVRLPMKFPFRTAGWAALAFGAAALVTGIWAVSADGDEIACSVSQRDDRGRCPNVRNTRALGAVLVGLGGAAATLGGAWLYIASGSPGVGATTERADRRGPRGASLLLGGTF
jgi:PEGA domain